MTDRESAPPDDARRTGSGGSNGLTGSGGVPPGDDGREEVPPAGDAPADGLSGRGAVRGGAHATHRVRDLVRSPEVVASVIVGSLTVFAAIAGAAATNLIEVRQTVTAPSSGELSGDVETLREQLTASQAEVADLRKQVETLKKENERLGGTASSDASDSTSDGGASGDTAAASDEQPVIFRESSEPFEIAYGSCIDLDSDASNWDPERDNHLWPFEPQDFCYVANTVDELQMRGLVVVEDGSETLAACEEQTLLMDDAIPVNDVREGTRICGVTSEDRPVSVGVVKVSDESVTLDVRVWE